MTHEELLRKLHMITPDEEFTLRSRSAILSTMPQEATASVWQMLVNSVQFGGAMVLTGLLFIVVLGGWSTWQAFSPFGLASLDPASLRAEAEAVDVQLQMTDIRYTEAVTAIENRAGVFEASSEPETAAKAQAESQAEEMGLVPSTSSTEDVSVDQALDALAE